MTDNNNINKPPIEKVAKKVAIEKAAKKAAIEEAAKKVAVEKAAKKVAIEEAAKKVAIEEASKKTSIKKVSKNALIEKTPTEKLFNLFDKAITDIDTDKKNIKESGSIKPTIQSALQGSVNKKVLNDDYNKIPKNKSTITEPLFLKSLDDTEVLEGDSTKSTLSEFGLTFSDKKNAVKMQHENHVLNQRFELGEIIGIGGMGVVYLAVDRIRQAVKKNDCSVAIKILGKEIRKHKQALLALQREAYKEQQFSHPNILKVYDFNIDGDIVYKVMELIKGQHIKDWIKEQFNSSSPELNEEYIKKVINIANEIAKGLDYVHQQGTVHSDLKPSNIFITNNGQVKVFDFGIARSISRSNFSNKNEDESIFDPATFAAFTPKYASYEMLNNGNPSPADDIYALGCIIYEMLSGRHPYNGKNAKEVIEEKIAYKEINGIPGNLEIVLKDMIAIKQKDRLSTMKEVCESLVFFEEKIVKYKKRSSFFSLGNKKDWLNKKFSIILLALSLGIADIVMIYASFSPSVSIPFTSVLRNMTLPSCQNLLLSDNDLFGEKCKIQLSHNDMAMTFYMEGFSMGGSNFAIMANPLNNSEMKFLGKKLTSSQSNDA
ncbi:MAG: serine/threonine protein kinase, partial [Francisellaceae bacterium]